MTKKFELTFPDKVVYTEIKCDYFFAVSEAKKWIKEKHPTVKKIKHIKK
jgi:hypothetical protein